MMDRYAQIRSRLMELAQTDDNLKAVIAIGSGTRRDVPADEFSDLDLIIAVTHPEDWLYGDKPSLLGDVRISFTEPTLGGGIERRMLYAGSLDVDLIVFTPDQLRRAVLDGVAGWVMNRGYSVLYDKMEIEPLIEWHVPLATGFAPMGEAEFVNTVNDFFFHAVWADKKLRRGEMWTAKMCIDAYLKRLLLRVLELTRSGEEDVWHDGRFLDRWAGEETVEALRGCFARYDGTEMASALRQTVRLFVRTGRQAAALHGFSWPQGSEDEARMLLGLDYSPRDGV